MLRSTVGRSGRSSSSRRAFLFSSKFTVQHLRAQSRKFRTLNFAQYRRSVGSVAVVASRRAFFLKIQSSEFARPIAQILNFDFCAVPSVGRWVGRSVVVSLYRRVVIGFLFVSLFVFLLSFPSFIWTVSFSPVTLLLRHEVPCHELRP